MPPYGGIAIISRVDLFSALSRQSASGAPFPQSAGNIPDPSGYWTHDLMHAAPHDRRSWQPSPFYNSQHQGHDVGWNTGLTGLHYGYLKIEHKEEQIHYDSSFNAHQSTSVIPTGPKSTTYSNPSSLKGSIGRRNGSKGRRSTIASISDHSDTASSSHAGSEESDPIYMSDDGHHINIEDCASTHLRPAPGVRSQNYHHEPILGDIQQGAHAIVVSQPSVPPNKLYTNSSSNNHWILGIRLQKVSARTINWILVSVLTQRV